MKIGITAIGYQCEEHLEKVFEPWEKVKNGELKPIVEELYISVAHACFIETFIAGYPNDSTDRTMELFVKYRERGCIEFSV